MPEGTGDGATPGASAQDSNQQGQQNSPSEPTTEMIKLSKEDYEKALQSEADKRVTEALKTAKTKWEKEYAKKIEQEREEAARMAQMSQQEKQDLLLKKREEELARKERELSRQSLQLETVKILEERKLPTGFSDWLIGTDTESTFENIKVFEAAFNEAVVEEVKNRLPRMTPRAGGAGDSDPATAFGNMIRRAAGRQTLR